MIKKIVIKGAKEHNLKNVSVEIPKDQFVVITGLSGSGKSSLAFDTIYAEGQRRYVESLSAYARQFLDKMKKPNVDLIEGLSPAIAIEQKNTSKNPRSTVATVTEIYDYMRVLFARAGIPYSPFTGKPITSQTITQIVALVKKLPKKYAAFFFGLFTLIAENLVCKNVDIIGNDILVKKSKVNNLGIADNASNCKLNKCETDNDMTCLECFVSASVNNRSSPFACLYPSIHAQFFPIHPSGFEFAET